MKKGTCSKCGSKNLVNDSNMGDKIRFHVYVCLDCGYSEYYASNGQIQNLKKLKEKGKI